MSALVPCIVCKKEYHISWVTTSPYHPGNKEKCCCITCGAKGLRGEEE